jgi:serine protease
MLHRCYRPLAVVAPWALLTAGLLLACGAQAFVRMDGRPAAAMADEQRAYTDRVIVKYKGAGTGAGASPGDTHVGHARAAAQRQGVSLSHQRRLASGADVMKLSRRLSPAQMREMADDLLRGDGEIEYVEPDRMLYPMAVPNDPLYNQQWGLFDATAGINAPKAWDLSKGSGVVVAVVDSGVRSHPDLSGQLVGGYDLISTDFVANDGGGRDADPTDTGDAVIADYCGTGAAASNSVWHGTYVAGILGAVANNGVGLSGVAPAARILPVRVLGRCGGYTSDVADGIAWSAGAAVNGVLANANPAKVINLSVGGAGVCGTTLQNAINKARALGALVVVAAGNETMDVSQSAPANCSGVVAVAAVGMTGARASYSNYGSGVTLAAPGGDVDGGIVSTLNSGATTPGVDNYGYYMGTSSATPHVSGVAALMLSLNKRLTPDQLTTLLKSSARAFPQACSGCGAGLLDANQAALAALESAAVAEVEPNGTRLTAQNITALPALVKGTMTLSAATADADYFKVAVAAGSSLEATLTPNSASDYQLYVFSEAGRLLAYSTKGLGLVDTATVLNSSAALANYYVLVSYRAGLSGSTGTYTLQLR